MIKNFAILGDSYSTYEGYIPEGYATYYSPQGRPDLAVCKMRVEETWWGRLIKEQGAILKCNNSWSGSTIGYTGYGNSDCSHTSSFIYRYKQLYDKGFFDRNQVDTLFVFGGTNDSWSDAPLGKMQYADWEEKDLFQVLPSICCLMSQLKEDLPKTKIVFLANCDIKNEIVEGMKTAGKYYKIKVIELKSIDKKCGHPTVKGMSQIHNQILKSLKGE